MKKRIWNLFGIAIMAVAIAFSLIQLKIPVVRAAGCPSNPGPDLGCNCNLVEAISASEGERTIWYCTYSCTCCSCGGGEHMAIEQTVTVVD